MNINKAPLGPQYFLGVLGGPEIKRKVWVFGVYALKNMDSGAWVQILNTISKELSSIGQMIATFSAFFFSSVYWV